MCKSSFGADTIDRPFALNKRHLSRWASMGGVVEAERKINDGREKRAAKYVKSLLFVGRNAGANKKLSYLVFKPPDALFPAYPR